MMIPPEWRDNASLWVAGLFGSAVSLPYSPAVKSSWTQRGFYVLGGIASAHYLSPVVVQHIGLGISAAAFLCGTLAGSVIAKAVELIGAIHLGDVLSRFFGRRE